MDTDAGRFVEEDRAREWMKRLAVGEVVEIKGEQLEVLEIKDRTVTLRLMSADDRIRNAFAAEQPVARDERLGMFERQRRREQHRHGRRKGH